MFNFRCSNCNSTGVEFHKDTYGSGNYLSCRCGWQYYGLDRIAALHEEQKATYDTEIAASAISERKEAVQATARCAVAIRLPKVIDIAIKLCAWETCGKGKLGRKAVRRGKSKYCSRDCSNRNARHRYRMRAKKEAA